ncbi:MAG TPA: GNAT family N-acetyltransferase [Pyrinomonadaceae bacterium]|nr:GNAT family N-acetyltransferase [Pyrinomonadaceae bacterium]
MLKTSTAECTIAPTFWAPPSLEASLSAEPLTHADERDALDFLAERPLHTVIMASFIRDNGVESPLNRGTFYACRDERGRLEGVALIGHATLVEARTERALAAFARLAQGCSDTHMIMGEQELIANFWRGYSEAGQEFRLACREMLFELRSPVAVGDQVEGLRLATHDDLELIIPVQAELAREESGVDPREVDPKGFRRRTARRVGQGRTWVLVRDGRLVFKAELQSETPEVVYLEGVYVDPSERHRGLGSRCLSQLSLALLGRATSICLLVNERNREAHDLYRRVGFRFRCVYDTIFLQRRPN